MLKSPETPEELKVVCTTIITLTATYTLPTILITQQIIKSLSEMCCGVKQNQDMAR